MWRHLRAWLGRVPVGDPVDRRNAVFLQFVLAWMGVFLPLNWLYLRMTVGFSDAHGLDVDRWMGLAIVPVAWACVWAIRRGHFRAAVLCFLVAQVTTQAVAYAATGLRLQMSDPSVPMLLVVLGGLLLGRRTLWVLFAVLLGMFAVGAVTDVLRALHAAKPWHSAVSYTPSLVIRYLIIIVVLDRCIAALRESLDESVRRSAELAISNARLRYEMGERERAQEHLVHAQKMEAVGRLAGGISHDFNHVLNVIVGYAGQRHRSDATTGLLHRALEGVEAAASRGTVICRKLLGFSRRDMPHPETFDAARAVRELAPMLGQLLGPAVRLEIDMDDAPAPLHIDRAQLELALLNIAANARDAMDSGGMLRIGVRRDVAHVEIDIVDNGHGMDASTRRRIFEPFFTTKPNDEGTGLGLSMAHDIVTAAGGSIRAESERGIGSRFVLRLPVAPTTDAGCPEVPATDACAQGIMT
ncbi:sensor histidine kinase [Luteibacter sp. NPDC031894]|uniref:sensor histidine kinase n=1 Tax=Luteibacter sp. NPDC031894 TaxID=3390572 RepID=UPI003CFF19A2